MHRKSRGMTSAWLQSGFALVVSLALLQSGCKDGDMTYKTEADGVACAAGEYRCQDNNVETCKANPSGVLAWMQHTVCVAGSQTCQLSGVSAHCADSATCHDTLKNQDEADIDCGGGFCPPCGIGKACNSDADCASLACEGKICRACRAKTAACHGNLVRICKDDHSGWDDIATCDPTKGEACNIDTKTCAPLLPLGSPKKTGDYYLFANFKKGASAWKGGYDVDSYVDVVADTETNYIYVNNAKKLDVYKVTLADTDKDGKMEPNQHPKNPDNTGPMEQRVLTFIKTYTNVELGQPSVGEIYALKDKIYFFKRDTASNAYGIFEFIFKTGASKLVNPGNPKLPLCVLGYDKHNNRWFAGYNSSTRRVYGFYPQGGGWAAEFDYPNLAGSHMDGLEVVMDPKQKISYVYVSDMTSDFLAQYYRDPKTNKWVQKNVFEYAETENQYVEGMGFGAFQHFWATSGNALYEVGGGDLQKYVGPQIE
jgi:hypothetical protein